jgi:hypothetical protein
MPAERGNLGLVSHDQCAKLQRHDETTEAVLLSAAGCRYSRPDRSWDWGLWRTRIESNLDGTRNGAGMGNGLPLSFVSRDRAGGCGRVGSRGEWEPWQPIDVLGSTVVVHRRGAFFRLALLARSRRATLARTRDSVRRNRIDGRLADARDRRVFETRMNVRPFNRRNGSASRFLSRIGPSQRKRSYMNSSKYNVASIVG